MITARFNSAKRTTTLGVITIAATVALILPTSVGATAGVAQTCTVGQECAVGEYLYDNEHNPITTPNTCTITSVDPDGLEYIHTTMSVDDEGWQYHEFRTPNLPGLYKTTICCTVGSEYLCKDKNFEIQAADTATSSAATSLAAVWGYSNRTMFSFGSLFADVWRYSNRTMPGFGSLFASIWKSSSQPVSSGEPTTNTINEITPLVDKPVIQNAIDEKPIDLPGQIQRSFDIFDGLYLHHQYIHSKIGLMDLKWDILPISDITKGLDEIDIVLGDESDGDSAETVFGRIAWLQTAWQWPVLDDINNQTQAIKATLRSIRLSATEDKTTAVHKEIESLVTYSKTLDQLIGGDTITNKQNTLMGSLVRVRDTAQQLEATDQQLDALLTSWNKQPIGEIEQQVATMTNDILRLNHIPHAQTVLQTSINRADVTPDNKVKNKILGLKGLLQTNALLLAKSLQSAVSNTWLEIGSVIFKSLLTNPSSVVSQEVVLKYYLPEELTQQDTVQASEGLSVLYDAQKNQLYVQGLFTLGPAESKTVEVRVQDKWDLSLELIESLRRQAAQLSQTLQGTAFFAQSVALKSDIDVSLGKVLVMQEKAVTPEQKIKAYREAQIELGVAQNNLKKLQELVTQANLKGSFFGFISRVPTLVIWGLIIVVAAGFLFLTVYMRLLTGRQLHFHIIAFLVFGLLSATISGITVGWTINQAHGVRADTSFASADTAMVLGVQEPIAGVLDTVADDIEVLTIVAPPGMTTVNLRQRPSTKTAIVQKLSDQEPVIKLEDNEQWVHVALINPSNEIVEGWVYRDYVQQYTAATAGPLSDTTPRL